MPYYFICNLRCRYMIRNTTFALNPRLINRSADSDILFFSANTNFYHTLIAMIRSIIYISMRIMKGTYPYLCARSSTFRLLAFHTPALLINIIKGYFIHHFYSRFCILYLKSHSCTMIYMPVDPI